jgi:hypothetical protein
VLVHRLLVERIDVSGFGDATRGRDLLCHRIERREGTTSKRNACPLAGEGAGDRAAHGAAPP